MATRKLPKRPPKRKPVAPEPSPYRYMSNAELIAARKAEEAAWDARYRPERLDPAAVEQGRREARARAEASRRPRKPTRERSSTEIWRGDDYGRVPVDETGVGVDDSGTYDYVRDRKAGSRWNKAGAARATGRQGALFGAPGPVKGRPAKKKTKPTINPAVKAQEAPMPARRRPASKPAAKKKITAPKRLAKPKAKPGKVAVRAHYRGKPKG